jgi:para-nitrobenzyl esterase
MTQSKVRAGRSFLAGVMLALWAAPAQADRPAPMVLIAQGAARGAWVDGVAAFKGLPYAAPPVGDLRWRPPEPPASWTGVRDATAFGADCMQIRGADPSQSHQPVSEDCLTINVWTPTLKGSSPVMVWIHGGGLTIGSASQPVFDGAALARRGVVVAAFDYRLGRFGFFAHPALTAEAAGGPVGNYGFMDQVAALRWVRRNIAAFGGDPAKVTVFGQSAGGESVNTMMLSAPARGLFRAAVTQSGLGRERWPTLAQAETKGAAFASRATITGEGASALAALRALPAKTVLGHLDLFHPDPGAYSGAMIDGALVQGQIGEGFAAGRQADVPFMIGANSNELGPLPSLLKGPLNGVITLRLGPDRTAVRKAYGSQDAYNAHLASDVIFVEPARALAAAAAARGRPVWLYSFGYTPEAKRPKETEAAHTSELAFVFGNLGGLGVAPTPADGAMASLMGDYWTSFARTLDPSGPGRPAWPPYRGEPGWRMEFTNQGARAAPADLPVLNALRDHYRRRGAALTDQGYPP